MAKEYELEILAFRKMPENTTLMQKRKIAVYGDEGVDHCMKTLGFDYDLVSRDDLIAGIIAGYDVFLHLLNMLKNQYVKVMKIENLIILVSILLGLILVMGDFILEYFLFDEKHFLDSLFFDVPTIDLYRRTLIMVAFVMFGIIVSRIMTKRKKAEIALHESERNYKDLFENANDAIFILDSEFNYVDVNQKAIDLFGFSREEFLQLNVKDVIPPEQYQKSDKEFAKLNEQGDYDKFIGKQKTKDGRWLDIEVSASAIIKNGKVIGSRDIVRDITARKEAEAKKERLIAELQNALAEIKTLRGIVPICAYCKKVRDDEGYWNQVEAYIRKHTEAVFSHGICPNCAEKYFPDLFEKE